MSEAPNKFSNARKYIRFKPDDLDVAYVMLTAPDADEFRPDLSALIVDESHKGCSIAILAADHIKEMAILYIKVGKLLPLKAQVVWKKDLDGIIERLGIMYLE